MKPRFFRSQREFRTWLERNHDTAREIWVGYYKKGSPRKGITYAESVDEALCFGWIDGLTKGIDETRYMQRFSPRTKRSPWSQTNLKRVGQLKRRGMMAPAGLAAFERRSRQPAGYSYEEAARGFEGEYLKTFRAAKRAWMFFQGQPPGYRKMATYWVMSAKREDTRQRRLAHLMDDSAHGRRLAMLA